MNNIRVRQQNRSERDIPEAAWDSYLATAREKYEEIDRVERYKIELGRALTRAREALLRDGRNWPMLVKEAIGYKQNNIVNWRDHTKLIEWIDRNLDEARGALLELWSEDGRPPGDRVRSFDAKAARERVPTKSHGHSPQMQASLGYPPYSAGDVGVSTSTPWSFSTAYSKSPAGGE